MSITSSGPGLLALASLARHRRIGQTLSVVAVTAVCWVVFELIVDSPMPMGQVVLYTLIATVGAAGIGHVAGSRGRPSLAQ